MRKRSLIPPLCVTLLFSAASRGEKAADGMTVTAYRTAQPLARAGSAISIVSRRDIEERQTVQAADALRALPGVAVARSGPVGAQTQIRIRGSEANHVLVLIDGVEANDVATDDAFSFEHLTTADIERIEVVRGPQSALWGSDSLAGVINVVTRQPEQPLETSAFLEGGSYGHANGGVHFGTRSDSASLTGSISHLRTDGTNASRSGNEDDAYDNTTAGLAGTLQPLDNLRLEASLRRTQATVEYDVADFDGILVDADNEDDIRHDYARFGGTLDLLDGRLNQQLHYAITQTDRDVSAVPFPSSDKEQSSTDGNKYGVYYQTSGRLSMEETADVLTFAVNHEREAFHQRGKVTSYDFNDDGVPDAVYDPNQDQSLQRTGYALEYLAVIGRDLLLSASARHDDNSDFDDCNTWRATLSWTLPQTVLRLHGSVGTGEKSPTFVERFGYFPGTFIGNPDLEPEKSTGWDIGIERHWLDGRLTTDLTYFQADLDNEIDGFFFSPEIGGYTAVNEDGESRRRGIEATLTAELTDIWSLDASYTYSDAEEGDQRIREVRRPLHTGSVNATGRWFNGRLLVNSGLSYVGERQDDRFSWPTTRVALDDYLLANVAVSYQLRPGITVYGRIENALDENYEDVFGYNTPGATVFAGVRMSLAH